VADIMPTKKSEQWYVDWIVEAGVCTDLPESLQSKDEVLLRLDNLLRQQGASIYLSYNLRFVLFILRLL